MTSPHWPGVGRYLGLLIDENCIGLGDGQLDGCTFIPAGEALL